ncbi:efflux RND transporter periplasmic adaptor subunit [Trinickia mobilis]|uniref:efflux RND transporter periplasmic adaptor subunit n=1 Tax=Trinickia mobilis TaxID=2816356 RepID=UPI001A8E94F0|nr:efflux RND transporter periplasmic adaptor subunit [Trinickia mobilis]
MSEHQLQGRKLLPLCGAVLVIGAVAWGIWSRGSAEAALVKVTNDEAMPTVSVIPAAAGPADEALVLPGTVQAEYETPIYARTSGYVKHWYTDIGTRVKAGTLLAEIDSPEVDQQLRQAKADLATAKANNLIAQETAKRVHALLPTQSVSAEQDDQATSDAAAKAALVAAAEANVERLTQLVGFERVAAPYDGVVTARETDVGDLINAGSGSGPELFRVADTSKLRIYVQVPQSYAALVKPGVTAALQFPEYPGRTFPANFTRSADAINPSARTLLVELETDNASGELFPGGYTDVHFEVPVAQRGVNIPANALLFRAEGVRVASVASSGLVALHTVTLGRDFGPTVEVTTGVAPGEKIILNPPASLADGERVRVQSDRDPAPGGRS